MQVSRYLPVSKNQKTKKLSFSGGAVSKSVSKRAFGLFKNNFDFKGNNLPFAAYPFLTFMVVFARLCKSRCDIEKETVLLRDVPSIITIIWAVPVLNKLFAHYLKKNAGMPVSSSGSGKSLFKFS